MKAGLLRLIKVVAYIVRARDARRELLVFRHRDFPDAGLQVPAGTVNEGEGIVAALRREVTEETGLIGLTEIVPLAVYDWIHQISGNTHKRHLFSLIAPAGTPDTWECIETSGGEVAEEDGYVFCFEWVDLAGEINLAGDQGDYLHKII